MPHTVGNGACYMESARIANAGNLSKSHSSQSQSVPLRMTFPYMESARIVKEKEVHVLRVYIVAIPCQFQLV